MNQDASLTMQEKIDLLNSQAWQVRVDNSHLALALSKEAVELSKVANYKKGLAEGLRTLGFSYIRLSKNNEAWQTLQQALPLLESLNDFDGQSDVYQFYGIIERSFGNYEASLNFLFKSLELRKHTGNSEGEALALYHLGVTYKYLGNYEKALDELEKALLIARDNNLLMAESYTLNIIGQIYLETEDYKAALEYSYQSLSIRRRSKDRWGEAGCLDSIGYCYFKTGDYKNSIVFYNESLSIAQSIADKKGEGNSLFHLGNIYQQFGDYQMALQSYQESLAIRKDIGDKKGQAEILLFLAELYVDEDIEHSVELMNKALKMGMEIKANDLLAKIHQSFYKICKKRGLFEEALAHLETYNKIEKEIHTAAINQKILNLEITHQVEISKKEAEAISLRNKELTELNAEIEKQKKDLETALKELKATQAQLIQSEKMASLGQPTAGIAHEIQNPLNFVNNFSEINTELIAEMRVEIEKGDLEEVKAIANDIEENEQKIFHHGKRADSIVKGMLEHSRASSGKKEITDINALVDECVRLSYHGMMAKDKEFNAEIKTDLDESLSADEAGIGKINIVPQDISRVLLNLLNNAFYAVDEKKRQLNGMYEPAVAVCTKKLDGKVEIYVKDNGDGIPQNIVDKIFQPFFTTKPTGQGTGLGLSLSYDIVKAHGGEIRVESKEGEGTTFLIQLPTISS